MGLRLSTSSLEERLSEVPAAVLDHLIHALTEKKELKAFSTYLKPDTLQAIGHYLQGRQITFGEQSLSQALKYLGNEFNWEPLKPIEYGLRVLNVPTAYLENLDDFEKIYFFAGLSVPAHKVLEHRGEPLDLAALTSYEIASVYIRAGIDEVSSRHNSILEQHQHPRTVQRGRRTVNYSQVWVPPHSAKIRTRLLTKDQILDRQAQRFQIHRQELIRGVEYLIYHDEFRSAAYGETLRQQLTACPAIDLQVLRDHFGERLNSYLVPVSS